MTQVMSVKEWITIGGRDLEVKTQSVNPLRQRDIHSRSTLDLSTGCWLWNRAKNHDGYGQIRIEGIHWRAHRLSYEAFREPIPKGLEIDHLCRVRACVNPEHLEVVTHTENVARGKTGVHNKRKTHCPQGHPYSGNNLRTSEDGWRYCRLCGKLRVRAYRARNQ